VGGRKITLGNGLEALISKKIHSKDIPLLISPSFLREYNCGQIDISSLYRRNSEWCVAIVEVKSKNCISNSQRLRLKRSGELISHILDCPITYFLATSQKILCQIS
jgi:hypothetical protein